MNDLPDLPFEQMLSYLNLEDLIKWRAVSRRWCKKIDSFKVKSLCYSELPSGRIFEKNRLVGGAFAPSFFQSSSFERFFNTFGQSILSNLKKLRLCELYRDKGSKKTLAVILHSFGQLEELSIIRFGFPCDLKMRFKLNLPRLNHIHLEGLRGIGTLTLDAPRLQKVKVRDCLYLRLNIVHAESVERLDTGNLAYVAVPKLKNLKYLCCQFCLEIGSTFLFSLKQLKEFHLNDRSSVRKLFEQKRQYGRADLKIYLYGRLLNGPEDPVRNAIRGYYYNVPIAYLAENQSTMADKISFCKWVQYSEIEHVAPELAINVLNRFTDLCRIVVDQPVQNIQRFLDFLKNVDHIEALDFSGAQPQELFDRLPNHCAVQELIINCRVLDFRFLYRLKSLIQFYVNGATISDIELIRKALVELPFLSLSKFVYNNKLVSILIENRERFKVFVDSKEALVGDVSAVIQFVTNDNGRHKKGQRTGVATIGLNRLTNLAILSARIPFLMCMKPSSRKL